MRKQEFRFQTNLPSPARRGSRSRPPLRRPRPLRFQRLRVPVWNPYSRDLNLIEEFKFKLQRRDNLSRKRAWKRCPGRAFAANARSKSRTLSKPQTHFYCPRLGPQLDALASLVWVIGDEWRTCGT